METKKAKENRLDNWVSLGFRLGVAISFALVIIGIILISIAGTTEIEPVVPLNHLPQKILELNAMATITLGILVLLLTPVLQVVVALVFFLVNKNKPYLGIVLALLCVLAFSITLALA